MLTAIMWLFGIDLERKVAVLKGHLHDAVDETSFRLRRELQGAGLFVIFAGLGAAALAGAMGAAAAALFLWLQQQYGAFAALAAVGGLCIIFAAIMFMLAIARRRTRNGERAAKATERKTPTPEPAKPSISAQRAQPASIPLSIPPLPENASLVDQLTHRFGQHALAASDEAVARAEQLMREGSSGALLTTLALTAAIGVVIGRRGGLHQ